MKKIFERHKYFYLIILALLTLVLGVFFFSAHEVSESGVDAGYSREHSYSYSVEAFYVTPEVYFSSSSVKDLAKNGNYTNTDGTEFSGSVGKIEVTLNNFELTKTNWQYDYDSNVGELISVSTTDTAAKRSWCWCKNEGSRTIAYRFEFSAVIATAEPNYILADSKTYAVWSGSGEFDQNDGSNVNQSREAYAVFVPQEYRITLKANGGEFSDRKEENSTWCFWRERYYNTTYGAGTALNNKPTRTGYYFSMWYYAGTNSSMPINENTIFDDVNKNQLTAAWVKEKYDFTFNPNGGTLSGSPASQLQTLYYGESFPTPTKVGYTFAGWNTNKNGNGTNYTGTVPDFGEDGADVTLYAKWTPNIYRVTINPNYGSVSDILNGWTLSSGLPYKYITFDTVYGTFPNLTRTGYTQLDYCIYNSTNIYSDTIMNTAKAHTITAQWREHKYTIIFDPGGGSGTMADMTGILYTQQVNLAKNTFTKAGYNFKGWSLTKGGNVKYKDKNYVSQLTDVDNGVVTLYAVWEETWANYAVAPSGQGTQSNPYLISTAENLAWMVNQTENGTADLGGYFKQTGHINLNGRIWKPIGNSKIRFIGNYDGQGYGITNLNTSNNKDYYGNYLNGYVGLFGYIDSAELQNINILSGNVLGYEYVGGIVGNADYSTIQGCQSYVSISAGNRAGGIAGNILRSTIYGCYSKSSSISIRMTGNVGGIVGEAVASHIASCGFEGNASDPSRSCLLVGYLQNGSTMSDCFGIGDASVKLYVRVSGTITISNCLWTAGTNKYYTGSDFSNWVISTTNTPLPSGLSWMATAGEKVTSINQIQALGYVAS